MASRSPKTVAAKAAKPSSVSELAQHAQPAEPAAKFAVGDMEFVVTDSAALPADIGKRATKVSALPFADWFTKMKVGQHVYLPDAFWAKRKADGHLNPDTKVDSTYVRSKVRASFNKWKDADESRKATDLVIYPRPTGISPADDPNFPADPRPGFSIYLVKGAPPV